MSTISGDQHQHTAESLYRVDLPHNKKKNKCNIRVIVWFTVTVAIDIHFCLISEMSLYYVGAHAVGRRGIMIVKSDCACK